ncbi:hypothetical protein V1477_002704 [Vespula maculifrons]|uniref:Uncharacterized protein n=1 Tax=Vespula maculifrons TaxID=7453 RepID=A0ABD2CVC6_VESMC
MVHINHFEFQFLRLYFLDIQKYFYNIDKMITYRQFHWSLLCKEEYLLDFTELNYSLNNKL